MQEIQHISIDLLDDHEDNAIFTVNREKLQGLADSIRTCGILEPLRVRKKDGGRYVIISGHRRKHAAIIAGEATAPCIVVEDRRNDELVELIMANIHNRNLSPMEKARSFRKLKEHFYIVQQRHNQPGRVYCNDCSDNSNLTERLKLYGIPERTFFLYDKLNNLIPELQELIDAGIVRLSLGERLASHSPELQRSLYEALGEETGKIPLKEVKKLKEETDRGYLVLEVLQKKLNDLENHITERAKKEGEIDELEKRLSQLKAKIRFLNHDLIDRQNAAKVQEEQLKKSGAVLLFTMEQIARPVAKAKPEIEVLLMNHQVDPNTVTRLLKWAQVLTETGQMVEAAVKKVIIFPVKKPQKKEMA